MLHNLLKLFPSTTNFCDASHRWTVHKLIDQPLSIHLGKNTSLVVIPESSAHGLIVHIWLVLVHPPQPGHSLAVHNLKNSFLSVAPFDEFWAAIFVLQIVVPSRDFLLQGTPSGPSFGGLGFFW